MKVFVCLTISLFIYDRDWSLNFLSDAKFICADNLEKVEEEKPIAWVGFQDRDFISPIFGKQTFRILGLLLNGGFLRFVDWSLLPRKPPDV